MFGFGKKKKIENENADLEKEAAKMPSGMKETAERVLTGQFDMNDVLTQLKQIKKMSNFSGILKMVPGMSGAVSAMKEKIKDGSVDAQIKILEAMTPEERVDPDKIFANAKARIAETAGCTVRDVEHMIKHFMKMKQKVNLLNRMGGPDAFLHRIQQSLGAQGGASGAKPQ